MLATTVYSVAVNPTPQIIAGTIKGKITNFPNLVDLTQISTSGSSVCGTDGSKVYCLNAKEKMWMPYDSVALKQISLSDTSACGVTEDSKISCTQGFKTGSSTTWTSVNTEDTKSVELDVKSKRICRLTSSGIVYCSAFNTVEPLDKQKLSWVQIVSNYKFGQISVYNKQICGIESDKSGAGALYCKTDITEWTKSTAVFTQFELFDGTICGVNTVGGSGIYCTTNIQEDKWTQFNINDRLLSYVTVKEDLYGGKLVYAISGNIVAKIPVLLRCVENSPFEECQDRSTCGSINYRDQKSCQDYCVKITALGISDEECIPGQFPPYDIKPQ
eukprot:NODE_93_length_21581_cov_0.291919.p5 type:complete len:330 gc:universal NODE_93_length_21581_cov_0.291919:8973-7984(-)